MPRPKRDVLAAAAAASSPPAELPTDHIIARIVQPNGNHLFTVERAHGDEDDDDDKPKRLLVELPVAFRNTFWLRRGGYVVVNAVAFAGRDNKLGGAIVTVIREEKEWRKMAYWPIGFPKRDGYELGDDGGKNDRYDENDDDEDDEYEGRNNQNPRVGEMPLSDSENDDYDDKRS